MTLTRNDIRAGAAALVAALDDIALVNEHATELEADFREVLGALRLLSDALKPLPTKGLDQLLERQDRIELARAWSHARTVLAEHPEPELEVSQ